MREYDVTAEFYDLLQATVYARTATDLLDRWMGRPAIGVLDVGAGTGLATELLAQRCTVTVHAVEPTRSMRSVLLSRLAGRPELLSHVRVHALPLQRLGLARVADFALCLNTIGTLDRRERHDVLDALAWAMTPGGTLVVQRPPDGPYANGATLPSWELGGDTYAGDVTCTPTTPDRIEWTFTYRVTRGDSVIREEIETFDGYLASAADFTAELGRAGFEVVDEGTHDVMVARRTR
jgi:SAM-dependent methyltransferase